ncbi:MAG: UDP-glucose 4-epimerase GalE, partial [Lachnospiraceae bacterium]|nr:UDP-glucose 4-epimerase GalE [Lachnospiraceae bacterium]
LADAHVRALRYLEAGGEGDFFNLGNTIGTSVLEVVESVKRVTGRDFTVTLSDRRPGDPAKLVGSSEKARRVLDWEPQYGAIDTIVSHAWNWHEHAEY